MKQSVTRQMFDYWDSLRAGRMAPERDDIDPAEIKDILQDTFILEVDAELTLPLRVAGTRISDLFTRELKGVSFPTLFQEVDRPALAAIMRAVLEDLAPVVAGIAAAPSGRSPADMEMLLLPLRHLGRAHARIIGSLTPVATSAWMGLVEAAPLSIISFRTLRPTAWSQTAEVEFPVAATRERASANPFMRIFTGGRILKLPVALLSRN